MSGGPDSLALLWLAHAAQPGTVEAATVDHELRPESAEEARRVAQLCAHLGVPHATLRVQIGPGNLQAQARAARYEALARWMAERGLDALATAHHADDQAETLLMRLNRGSGVAGLAGVRARGEVPGSDRPMLRPLLGWRRQELASVVGAAGWAASRDPSNTDERFDRARLRKQLAGAEWLDPVALATSAGHLSEADEALAWAAEREWHERVEQAGAGYRYRPAAPKAVRLRVLARIVRTVGREARGGEVARLEAALSAGEGGTLGGVIAACQDHAWHFRPEPARP